MRVQNWLQMAVCGGLMWGGALVAHADTFSVSGVLAGQAGTSYAGQTGTVTGTVSIDLATETVTGSALQVTGFGLTGVPANTDPGTSPGDYIASQQTYELTSFYFPNNPGQLEYVLKLYVPTGSLGTSGVGPICSVASPCGSGLTSELQRGPGAIATLQSGTVTPVAATPEPSELWLLGTGVLGGAGMLRRRIRR